MRRIFHPVGSKPLAHAATAATLSLSGSVRDDAGQPVAGASVAVLDGVNANRAATTDTSGRYSISGLSGGGFTVRVRSDGYNDATQSVTLTTSATLDVSISRNTINLTGTLTGTYTYTDFRTPQRYGAARHGHGHPDGDLDQRNAQGSRERQPRGRLDRLI